MANPLRAPKDQEQDASAAHIRDSTHQLDAAMRRSRCEIALIREYRARLFPDVAAGKLDVRGVKVWQDEDATDDTLNVAVDGELMPDDTLAMEDDG